MAWSLVWVNWEVVAANNWLETDCQHRPDRVYQIFIFCVSGWASKLNFVESRVFIKFCALLFADGLVIAYNRFVNWPFCLNFIVGLLI